MVLEHGWESMRRSFVTVLLMSVLFVSGSLLGGVASAAETGGAWITPVTPSASARTDGIVTRSSAYLRGVSDDGSAVLHFGSLGLEVSVVGRADNYRLADLLGGQSQERHAALSGDGQHVGTVQPRYGGEGEYLGFDVLRWEPAAGDYRLLAEVRDTRGFVGRVWISTDGRYVFYYHPVDWRGFALTRVDAVTRATRTIPFRGGSPEVDYTAVSGNGRYVLYIADPPEGGGYQARRIDVWTGTEVILAGVSGWRSGSNLRSIGETVAISPSGRYVSYAGVWLDVDTGTSIRFTGGRIGTNTTRLSISIDNEGVVAWITEHPFVDYDTNGEWDAYAWQPGWNQPRLVSVSDLGTLLENASLEVMLAGDGGRAVFESIASVDTLTRPASGGPGALYIRDLRVADPEDAGVVDAALRPAGGYWTVNRAGVVRGHLGARSFPLDVSYDARPVLAAGEEVTSISAASTGQGYWLFTSRGRVIVAGDATHHGDLTGIDLRGEIVDSVTTPSGEGYYMVGADGGVFAFGDAAYRGSVPAVLGSTPLAAPIVAIAVTPSNKGYRMVASDGGVFNFGNARYFGSVPEVLPGVRLAGPVIGVVSATDGYLNVATDGGIFNFGTSPFHGSLGASPPPADVSSVMVLNELTGHEESGYVMVDRNGTSYGFGSGVGFLG